MGIQPRLGGRVINYLKRYLLMENDFVYVLSKEGEPLMPTRRFGKVRWWLKNGEAHVVHRNQKE